MHDCLSETTARALLLLSNVGARILVVDDNTPLASMIADELTRSGHAVTCLATGDGALASAHQIRPHAVIADLHLPGMNGLDLCARLRSELPDTAVIVTSAYDPPASRVAAMRAGARVFLAKPFGATDLVAAVHRCTRS
jgi:DNA-binding response OmpR family regulator